MSMLYEFEGKLLFKDSKIPIPRIKIYIDAESINQFAEEIGSDTMMAKGQALAGGRGKAGLIRKVTKDTAEEYIKSIIGREHKGKPVAAVMLEETVEITKEYYLALMLDNKSGSYLMLASTMGGVDIEEVADNHPNEIHRTLLPISTEPQTYHFMGLGKKMGFEAKTLTQFASICVKMLQMAIKNDLTLVEINPLVTTPENKLIAADSKVVIDGNAYFRQPSIAALRSQRDQYTDLEFEATQAGISYVQLDGDIGIIAGGAGLSMATCDLLELYGSSPANFLDVGGGADDEKVYKALELLSKLDIKGIFVNFFAGITRCDDVANGIVTAKKKLDMKVPMVIRMVGTKDIEGIQILKENGIHAYNKMEPSAQKIVELVKGGN
ncbi:MAG: ADP-forming succinate--CoA ligase subunit beta [Candidatus Heimdallarchaeota archaeon]|nr:ADP-forming succinate--CoA ligase subunit beta [Candidatus Heimdallarchaeota archaeon]